MFSAAFIILVTLSSCSVTQISAKCRSLLRGPPCHPQWHHRGTSCYMVTQSQITWSNARDECANMGGILAVPNSLEENDFIVDNVIPDGEIAWIDCTDEVTEGTWVCKEGEVEVSYRNWDTQDGEPSNLSGESCAVITRIHGTLRKWHDYYCTPMARALCKKPVYK